MASAFVEQLYASLPEYLQRLDTPDQVLKRFLSIEGDVGAGVVLDLVERLDGATNPAGVSALLDATQADPAWLPWLAQLRGVRLRPSMTVAQQRVTIATAAGGLTGGSSPSIAAAAGTVLTGTKRVLVLPGSVAVKGDGQWYDILVLTRPEETPDSSLVIPAIIAADAKPAGTVLHWSQNIANYAHLRDIHGTYTQLEAAFPTYDAMTHHIPE
jgi:hypothetical protein